MKTFIKEKKLWLLNSLYSLVCALFWTALRVNYAGISKALGADKNESFLVMYSPLLILALTWAVVLLSLTNFKKCRKGFAVGLLIMNIIDTGLNIAIVIGGSYDYLDFILPKFYRTLAVSAVIIIVSLFLFVPFENQKIGKVHKRVLVTAALIAAVIVGFDLKKNNITYDSVVYAVEDDYQIVFSTNDNSVAWVEIDGEKYYELYSGSMRSKELVHKIIVPQEKLDNAKSYTICAQQMIYRGPFGGFKGAVISKTHSFRPVNSDDGLNYFVMSDIHGCYEGACNAAKSVDNLDFIVLLGDSVSMVEYDENANFANRIAFNITKGEMPVIYARGNHEIKGNYAEDLYKYVGSSNGNFYYTVRLGNIYGIVLDMGEDHDDDWWEYYGTAQFDIYRQQQTQLLQNIVDSKANDGYEYTMVMCHIPINFVNARHNHAQAKEEWTALINQLNVDVALYGHQHDLSPFVPGQIEPNEVLVYNSNYSGTEGKTYKGYMTDFNFYGFMAGRPFADDQTSEDIKLGKKHYTGLHIIADLNSRTNKAEYINSKGETVAVCNMFTQEEPLKEFVFTFFRKEMVEE